MILPNEHLLNVRRVKENMGERTEYVRLDRNERVEPVSQAVFQDMLTTLEPEMFCAYPDPTPLYQRLSKTLNVPEEYLYLTNGSDAAIRMLFQTFVRPGDSIIFPDPTYAMYAIYSQIFQAQARTIPYEETMKFDIDLMLEYLMEKPRILAIANPDQPTGSTLSESIIRKLAAAARDVNTLFVVDEAYFPFYPRTVVDLVHEFDNIVITRTFSKVGGLAGLRLGYFAAHPEIVHNVHRIRGAHEVNEMSIAIGNYVLDHPELTEQYLADVEAGRNVLEEAALDLGLGFPECPANFQLIRFTGMNNTQEIVASLKQQGYLVKGGFSSPAVQDCIRITLGGPDVMIGFVDALRCVTKDLWRKP
ncbi:MAG: aminotransferase class I/II-fold pyridoxal phosphate-dependent enzyme [Anaerolineales bacterium]|nr:MAG: aminotransferase class I/II-fold pyridoxal phosphate-dependent enzyme [Anaerolineales bacterium]